MFSRSFAHKYMSSFLFKSQEFLNMRNGCECNRYTLRKLLHDYLGISFNVLNFNFTNIYLAYHKMVYYIDFVGIQHF